MHLSRSAALIVLFSSIAAWAQGPAFTADPADALVDANHYKRARAMVDARLQRDPRDAHSLYLSSKIQEALGNLRGALAQAEKSVEIDPLK